MSIKKYVEHHLQLHTLRVELLNGKVLLYNIDVTHKEELEQWLRTRTDDSVDFSDRFLSFHANPSRMVFIRIAAIGRLIFCWDMAANVVNPTPYHDNFECSDTIDDELLITPVIIMLHGVAEPLLFNEADAETDFLGLDEESLSNKHFLKGGFISLPDEDGEQNYIPVRNIDYLEADRAFFYPDDMWEDMQRMRDIENNKN